MTRYYFNFRDGAQSVVDQTGREFPNDAAARQEAVLTARDAVAGIRLGFRHYGGWTLEVLDHAGREVYSIVIPKTV